LERPPAWHQAPSERESELRVTRRRLDLGEPCKHKLGYPHGGGHAAAEGR